MNNIIKYIYIGGGFLSIALGVLGMFLPVLPTTPFLLLASFCFARSSKRWYNWLINHHILGKYITDFMIHKALTVCTKIWIMIVLWSSMGLSMWLTGKWSVAVILAITGLGVSYYILFSLGTLPGTAKSVAPENDPLT